MFIKVEILAIYSVKLLDNIVETLAFNYVKRAYV